MLQLVHNIHKKLHEKSPSYKLSSMKKKCIKGPSEISPAQFTFSSMEQFKMVTSLVVSLKSLPHFSRIL